MRARKDMEMRKIMPTGKRWKKLVAKMQSELKAGLPFAAVVLALALPTIEILTPILLHVHSLRIPDTTGRKIGSGRGRKGRKRRACLLERAGAREGRRIGSLRARDRSPTFGPHLANCRGSKSGVNGCYDLRA